MRELRQDRVTPLTLTPEDVHLPLGSFSTMALPSPSSSESVPAQEAAIIHKVLHNQIRDRFRDWVIYNAAMLLYAAGQASSIAAGVPLAQRALASGTAAHKLADLTSTPAPSRLPENKVVHV